jgi:Putative transposase
VLYRIVSTYWIEFRERVERDGTRFVRLDPYESLARICAMVPPPWFNMIRFHGVLAPNTKLREQVVASAKPYVLPQENTVLEPLQLPLLGKEFDEPEANVSHKRRKPWVWLLKHVFAIDVNGWPKCGGRMNDASCVTLRSLLPAPMRTCVRGSRKLDATERRRSPSEPGLCLDACECTNPQE